MPKDKSEVRAADWQIDLSIMPPHEPMIPVNAIHLSCPNCGEKIDITPPENTHVLRGSAKLQQQLAEKDARIQQLETQLRQLCESIANDINNNK
jgi:hypothetical protein